MKKQLKTSIVPFCWPRLDTLEVAGSYFWLGKVSQAQGDLATAQAYWQNAATSDPYGYYGIRSAELLNGQSPFPPVSNLKLTVNLDEERLVAGDWLKPPLATQQVNLDYSSELFEDTRYIRGLEYHQLGSMILPVGNSSH